MIIIVDAAQELAVMQALRAAGEAPVAIGELSAQNGDARVTHQGQLAL